MCLLGRKPAKTKNYRAYREKYESEFILLNTDKRYFDVNGIKKVPEYKTWKRKIEQLVKEKNEQYNEYRYAK
jgi:hypothetical protein